jgi:lactoylglutathione lyase
MTLETPQLGWTTLYVDDVAASTRFYAEALGLAVRFEHESGTYTEFETGPTTLALLDRLAATDATGLACGRTTPTGNVTLACNDVAARWSHAIAHGATAIHAPVDKPWGQTSSFVTDPDGNLIEIATPLG